MFEAALGLEVWSLGFGLGNQSSSCCPANVAGLSQVWRARRHSQIQTNAASDHLHELERGAAQTAKSRGLQHARASSALGMQAPQGIGFGTKGLGKQLASFESGSKAVAPPMCWMMQRGGDHGHIAAVASLTEGFARQEALIHEPVNRFAIIAQGLGEAVVRRFAP